ncbi:hypothetical protein [Acidipila sp. EB88]|uniref:hypothetical protein n=1 Tax=Acidipila sp. EB88 TaxID=2305226 RepID=UPI000F5E2725|nr:hypothetical protein [Acidipila sp. EB88]
MVSPSIDKPSEPFSYPSQSVDEIGAMFAPSAAELTPSGSLYTGFGELMLFNGIDRTELNNRVRTLEQGYLPVVSFTSRKDGIDYTVSFFASTLADGQTVNFVRVRASNPGATRRTAFLTASWSFTGRQTTTFPTGDNRFRRPLSSALAGDFHQPGEEFRPDSAYTIEHNADGNAALRDSRVIFLFPQHPQPAVSASYRDYYNRSGGSDDPARPLPNTPMATVEYSSPLAPGADLTLDFKVPLIPISAHDVAALAAVRAAAFDMQHTVVIQLWRQQLSSGMQIQTGESKVDDLFRASLTYCLLALNHIGDTWIQTINQFQYHRFYLRDSADFVRMYDTTGHPDLAAKVLDFYGTRQTNDGNFVSQPGQYDGWGLAVWSIVEHYRITHDRTYAERMLPRIRSAVNWLDTATARDPLHLLPATDVRDNEYIPGHLTGYNFLALDGLDSAILMARALGSTADEKHFQSSRDNLHAAFLHQLDAVTNRSGGYIPPALDGDPGGTDWGNLLSLVPEQQLSPFDPRVTATLRRTQGSYAEGLITYRQPGQGTYLHHYLTIKNTLSELIRGEDEQAIRELDAVLVHTTSTNAGWEYSIRPWGNRDFSGNLSPHGWFAAEYRNLLRNMMVREEGNTLHLLSAVSPAWVGGGKTLRVTNADTYFGRISFDLEMPSEGHATLHLVTKMQPEYGPRQILLHIPFFEKASRVVADGKPIRVVHGTAEIPLGTKQVDIDWTRQPLSPQTPASYLDAVDRYKAEYLQRFQQATGWQPDATNP